MSSLRQLCISVFALSIVIFSLFITTHSVQAVACAGTCGGSYTCNSGLSCDSTVKKCGIKYNSCLGSTCVLDNSWDTTAPCDTADACTPGGSTHTAAFGACSVACGTGLKTCNCNTENNCPVTCTGGVACAATAACCVDQAPQTAPVITAVGSGSCSKNDPMIVNWTFADTGSTCDLSWGYNCAGNTNTFTIKVDGVVNTSNISSTERAATISTSIAASHQIQVCSNNGFGEKCSTSFSVTIDNISPPKPVDTMEYVQDSTCLGRFTAKYSWSAVSDTGCAGDVSYWSQGSSDSGFGSVLYGWNNTWDTPLTQSSVQSYPPGTQLYFRVQSRDAVDNQSGWTSTTMSAIVPTPSPFPSIHVSGPLVEDVSNTCYGGMVVDPASLIYQPVINPSDGTTFDCKTTDNGTKYSCDFTIDNQHGACYDNTLQIQLSASYPGYGTIGWRAGDACSGALSSIVFTPGDSKTSVPLFLTYGSADSNDGNWFKLSKSSFNSRQSGRHNVVPNTFIRFDSDDSTANRNIMINSSGVLIQNSPVLVGAGTVSYSSNNWYTNGYQYTNDVSYAKYVDYLKARKDYKKITNLSEIAGDGVYSITAPVTLTSTQFDGKKVVLVVEGTGLTTFGENFIPTNGSVAVLGQNIAIDPAVTEVDAIIVGETVSTGVSSTGLKIKGNLIDESAIQIERTQPDARKPSLFVIFDAKMYLDVLPYLSTSTYDWRQIQ